MNDTKVDLADRTVYIGEKKYWYIRDSDSDEEDRSRKWYRESKTLAYIVGEGEDEDEREKVPIEEIREAQKHRKENDGPIDWVPAERRVKDEAKIRLLNKLVDRAKAEKRKQKKAAESKRMAESRNQDQTKHAPKQLEPKAATQVNEGRASRKSGKSSVSFALKSATSDYVLNFRAAPSKKSKNLYNVSVHLGSKFVGYVEVPVETVVEFGQRLVALRPE